MDVLPRAAVTSLMASVTFSTMVDILMFESVVGLTEDELEVNGICRRSLSVV